MDATTEILILIGRKEMHINKNYDAAAKLFDMAKEMNPSYSRMYYLEYLCERNRELQAKKNIIEKSRVEGTAEDKEKLKNESARGGREAIYGESSSHKQRDGINYRRKGTENVISQNTEKGTRNTDKHTQFQELDTSAKEQIKRHSGQEYTASKYSDYQNDYKRIKGDCEGFGVNNPESKSSYLGKGAFEENKAKSNFEENFMDSPYTTKPSVVDGGENTEQKKCDEMFMNEGERKKECYILQDKYNEGKSDNIENSLPNQDEKDTELLCNSFKMRAYVLLMGIKVFGSKPNYRPEVDFRKVESDIEDLILRARKACHLLDKQEFEYNMSQAEELYSKVAVVLPQASISKNTKYKLKNDSHTDEKYEVPRTKSTENTGQEYTASKYSDYQNDYKRIKGDCEGFGVNYPESKSSYLGKEAFEENKAKSNFEENFMDSPYTTKPSVVDGGENTEQKKCDEMFMNEGERKKECYILQDKYNEGKSDNIENSLPNQDEKDTELLCNSFKMRAYVLLMGIKVFGSKPNYRPEVDFRKVESDIEDLILRARKACHLLDKQEFEYNMSQAEELYSKVAVVLPQASISKNTKYKLKNDSHTDEKYEVPRTKSTENTGQEYTASKYSDYQNDYKRIKGDCEGFGVNYPESKSSYLGKEAFEENKAKSNFEENFMDSPYTTKPSVVDGGENTEQKKCDEIFMNEGERKKECYILQDKYNEGKSDNIENSLPNQDEKDTELLCNSFKMRAYVLLMGIKVFGSKPNYRPEVDFRKVESDIEDLILRARKACHLLDKQEFEYYMSQAEELYSKVAVVLPQATISKNTKYKLKNDSHTDEKYEVPRTKSTENTGQEYTASKYSDYQNDYKRIKGDCEGFGVNYPESKSSYLGKEAFEENKAKSNFEENFMDSPYTTKPSVVDGGENTEQKKCDEMFMNEGERKKECYILQDKYNEGKSDNIENSLPNQDEKDTELLCNSFKMRAYVLLMGIKVFGSKPNYRPEVDFRKVESDIEDLILRARKACHLLDKQEFEYNMSQAEELYSKVAVVLPQATISKNTKYKLKNDSHTDEKYEVPRTKSTENTEVHSELNIQSKSYKGYNSESSNTTFSGEYYRTDEDKKAAETCIDIAKSAMSKGNFDKAKNFLLKSLRLYPNDPAKALLEKIDDLRKNYSSTGYSNINSSSLGNKDEAEKCVQIAEVEFAACRLLRAERLLHKAERLCPTTRAKDLLRQIECARVKGVKDTEEGKPHKPRQSHQENKRQNEENVRPKRKEPTPEHVEAIRQVKEGKDDYEILGVKKESSAGDVKKAFRKLTLLLHPDKNKAPGAKEAFMMAAEALERLKRKNSASGRST